MSESADTPVLLKLLCTRPREVSGSRTANRYDFQKNWTICRILDLHSEGKNYLVVCDYHEDVVVISGDDSEGALADFYQIKTRLGSSWTLRLLLERKAGGKNGLFSILGKLYSNFLLAHELTKSLNLVSNAVFKIKMSDGTESPSRSRFGCHELDRSEIDSINVSLQEEHSVTCNLPSNPPLFFEVTPLSLQDSSTHTKGKIAEVLEKLQIRHVVTPVYRILFDEIRRKTGFEGSIDSWEELRRRKAIGRSDIEDLLTEACTTSDTRRLWELVQAQLIAEKMTFMEVREIGLAWERYEINRMDATNESLQRLRVAVASWLMEILEEERGISLARLGDEVLVRVRELPIFQNFDRPYILALAFMEAYEKPSVPKADQKLEEGPPCET